MREGKERDGGREEREGKGDIERNLKCFGIIILFSTVNTIYVCGTYQVSTG